MSDDLFLSTNHDGKWTVINMNINPSKIRNGINGGIDHKQIYLFISENKNIFQLNPTFEKKLAGNRDFLRTIAFDTNKHQQQHMQWEHHIDHYCCCYWPRSIHLIMDFIPATYADWLQKGITPSANDQMNLIVWVEGACALLTNKVAHICSFVRRHTYTCSRSWTKLFVSTHCDWMRWTIKPKLNRQLNQWMHWLAIKRSN